MVLTRSQRLSKEWQGGRWHVDLEVEHVPGVDNGDQDVVRDRKVPELLHGLERLTPHGLLHPEIEELPG
jgi:hypothetical protein